jgi:capsular polysaccharide biosynthesis protein
MGANVASDVKAKKVKAIVDVGDVRLFSQHPVSTYSRIDLQESIRGVTSFLIAID